LVWVTPDGHEEPLDLEPQPYWWPQVSPDGDQIGLHIMEWENMDFHIYDPRLGTTSRFTRDPANDGYPLWAPDGERVVFWSARQGAVFNLFTRSADGTGSVERLTASPNRQIPHSWGSDGSLVFTEASPDTLTDIWQISIDGDRTPEPVLQAPYDEDRPAVSPDGRLIAYQSNESGAWQIWVRPFPDVESGRWQVGTGGESPEWSPDGRTLYYRGDDAMMAVQIDTTEGFSAAPAFALFEDRYVRETQATNRLGQAYAVAPDGRFLMMKNMPQSGTAAQLIVVRNWFEELNRLVPID
jgi:Tol biopolymer transport system component